MAAITYKCPNCGGGLMFDPEKQNYKCEYCLSEFTEAKLQEIEAAQKAKEEQKEKERQAAADGQSMENSQSATDGQTAAGGQSAAKQRPAENGNAETGGAGASAEKDAVLYTCPSCGAQIVTDETTSATFCYYCHNPVVLSGRLTGTYKPDYVIPFQIDRKKAEELFAQWIGKKKYVPEAFYNKKQIETMTGVYFPYWLYSCNIDGQFQAQGTKLRVWTAGDLRYTETKVYNISRQGNMKVDNVSRNALQKANRKLVDGVLPFQMEAKKAFSMGYLSGFVSENRDMEKQQFVDEVQKEVKNFALSSLSSQAGAYSSVRVDKKEAAISGEHWSYALLPVWTLTYNDKSRGKIYYFALNGQTGKICGELPVDNKKLFRLFVTIFLPIFILLLIGGYFW